MKEFSYTITNEYDLAAKPAFDLIKLAGEHDCRTYVVKNDHATDIKKLFILLSIVSKCGDTIKLVTRSPLLIKSENMFPAICRSIF